MLLLLASFNLLQKEQKKEFAGIPALAQEISLTPSFQSSRMNKPGLTISGLIRRNFPLST
jgi:phosphatidylserine synthase